MYHVRYRHPECGRCGACARTKDPLDDAQHRQIPAHRHPNASRFFAYLYTNVFPDTQYFIKSILLTSPSNTLSSWKPISINCSRTSKPRKRMPPPVHPSALRAFFLWYWKVNIIIENQEKQIALLSQLVSERGSGTTSSGYSQTNPDEIAEKARKYDEMMKRPGG